MNYYWTLSRYQTKDLCCIAVQHMTTYWAILEKVRGSKLRLTKIDNDIYEHFKKDFPEFDSKETIDENKMKSKEGKERWRNFMLAYEKKIDDYNFGTMLRGNIPVKRLKAVEANPSCYYSVTTSRLTTAR